jgi:hypothetical protein
VTGAFEVAGAAFMVIPLASGASAVMLGVIMISATLIELLVLRRPPIAAMACLSAHTYVAWGRLLHRPVNDEALAPQRVEIAPADATAGEPVRADAPTLVNDHPTLHEGMNVAAVGESAGGVEGSRD